MKRRIDNNYDTRFANVVQELENFFDELHESDELDKFVQDFDNLQSKQRLWEDNLGPFTPKFEALEVFLDADSSFKTKDNLKKLLEGNRNFCHDIIHLSDKGLLNQKYFDVLYEDRKQEIPLMAFINLLPEDVRTRDNIDKCLDKYKNSPTI